MGGELKKDAPLRKERAGTKQRSRLLSLLGRIVPSKRFSVGIDLGAYSARFVVVEKRGKGEFLRDSWKVEKGGRNESEAFDEVVDLLTKSLKRIAGMWTHREIPVFLAISGRDEIVKKLAMPAMPRRELKKALILKFEKELTSQADDITIGYCVRRDRSPEEEQNPEITAAMFKSESLEDITRPFEAAGFLSVNPVASSMLYSRVMPGEQECMLVDIGLEKTIVYAASPGKPYLYREIAFGGASLTGVLTGRFSYAKGVLELNSEAAENLKRKYGVSSEHRVADHSGDAALSYIPIILRTELAKLTDELRRTLDYAKTGLGIMPPVLCLSGGGSSLPGLVPYLEQGLGVKVKLVAFDDLRLVVGSDASSRVPPHELGLALAAAKWNEPQGILLTRASWLRRTMGTETRLFRTAAVLLAGFIALYSSKSVGVVRESKVDTVLTNYSTLMASDLGLRAKELDEEKKALTGQRSILSFTPPVRPDVVSLLREVSHIVPTQVTLTRMEMVPEGSSAGDISSSTPEIVKLSEEATESKSSTLYLEGVVNADRLLLESELSGFTRTLQSSGLFQGVKVLAWGRDTGNKRESLSFALTVDIADWSEGAGK
jgi:Tfp pilus assembly PilM family ATPase